MASGNENITQILNRINKRQKIPLSTLKLNAQILRNLGLITFGTNSHFQLAELTDIGKWVLALISRSSLTVDRRSSETSVCSKAAVCKTANPGSNPGSETEKKR